MHFTDAHSSHCVLPNYVTSSGLVMYDVFNLFFFKQKTAYEMRISDWSSDVCSSDLLALTLVLNLFRQQRANAILRFFPKLEDDSFRSISVLGALQLGLDRKSVV